MGDNSVLSVLCVAVIICGFLPWPWWSFGGERAGPCHIASGRPPAAPRKTQHTAATMNEFEGRGSRFAAIYGRRRGFDIRLVVPSIRGLVSKVSILARLVFFCGGLAPFRQHGTGRTLDIGTSATYLRPQRVRNFSETDSDRRIAVLT